MDMDLFEREQQIFDSFLSRIAEIHRGAKLAIQDYVKVAEEYGKLLKQLRGFLEGNFDFADKINYDVLTGIYNKRYLKDSLKRIIASAARHSTEQLTVMMLSVDYFKSYMDKYGKGESQNC
jgi:PleD family two-component response regulator